MRIEPVVFLGTDDPVDTSTHEGFAVLHLGDLTLHAPLHDEPCRQRRLDDLAFFEQFANRILAAVDEARAADRLLAKLPEAEEVAS
ncbi:MAG TPA: hypothetical protein VHT75_19450 [Acidimicrobiales bacterium]|jgi:hypothetical protein|nr:hypothetical protein [Acidimicrobiales bacterium]